jgi:hypothetical protein
MFVFRTNGEVGRAIARGAIFVVLVISSLSDIDIFYL